MDNIEDIYGSFCISSPEEMKDLAGKLSIHFRHGGCLGLIGPPGAGKTVLASCLIHSLLNNNDEPILSPTYCIEKSYASADLLIRHCDFYRINSEEEFMHLDVFENTLNNVLVIIEWPERSIMYIPDNAVGISIEFGSAECSRFLKIGLLKTMLTFG